MLGSSRCWDCILTKLSSWIDLPKEHKLVEPSYQELKADQIPTASISEFVSMKVICGKAETEDGKVVESPVRSLGGCWFFDVTISKKGESVFQAIPAGWNSFVSCGFEGAADWRSKIGGQ